MMIEVFKIAFAGFLSFGDTVQELNVSGHQGFMTLIEGVNNDEPLAMSNGSGKSSLLELFTWGFYGKLLRNNKYADEVVHKGSVKAYVKVTFALKNRLWEIMRIREKGKSEKLWLTYWDNLNPSKKDKGTVYKSGTAQQIQGIVENLIGMNYTAFCCSVIFGQDHTCFPDLRPADRMRLLSEVRGLDRYTSASKKARERASAATSAISGVKIEQARIQGQIDVLESQDFAVDIGEWEAARNSSIGECANALLAIDGDIAALQMELDAKKEVLDAQIVGYDKRLTTLSKKIENWAQLSQEKKTLQVRLGSEERAINASSQNKSKIEGNLAATTRQIETLKNSKNICPLCKSKVTPAHFKDELNRLLAAENTLQEELDDACHDVIGKGNIRSATKEELDAVQARIDSIYQFQQQYQTLSSERAAKVQEHKDLSNDEGMAALVTERGDTVKIYNEWVEAANPYREMEDNRVKGLATLSHSITALDAKIEKEEDQIAGYTFWAEGFKKIQYALMDDMIASLENEVRHFMGEYSTQIQVFIRTEKESKSGTMKDEIHIIVEDDSGEISYDMYSGGERQKVRMAIQMALSNLITNSCGVSFNFQAFDEPNTGLDDEGKIANFRVFSIFSDQDKAVFVTDHDSDFKDKFEARILISKFRGESTIQYSQGDLLTVASLE